MVAITYAVEVCDESRELRDLLKFLIENKSDEDDIHVLVDSGKVTPSVREVLAAFADFISTAEREHDGDFSAHRNFHASLCKGDYIFMIDADEIPQETLIKNIRQFDQSILCVPRINILPGHTAKFLQKHNFRVNEAGFINWPDYQMRYYKNDGSIEWSGKVHEKLTGAEVHVLESNPATALWHVKSVTRQDAQNAFYDTLEE